MIRKAPCRAQAVADAALATASQSGHVRDLRASLGCCDVPLNCLTLDDDYIIINKPTDVRMDGNFDLTVEKLIRHWCSEVACKEIKWVHQLDYATSGVLCVALHHEAASRACEAFRERRVRKVYLAVVQGTVDPSRIPERAVKPSGWGQEAGSPFAGDPVRGKRGKSKARSVQHNPAHVFFQQQKEVLIAARQRGETLSDDEAVLANASWGDIKHHPLVSKPFREASKRDRDRVAARAEEALFAEAQGAPDRGIFRAPGDHPRTFRVDASVSEIPGDFRMRVDDRPSRECKACRTEVEVLQTGFYRGQPVTKLLMRPHTGRRHQLRLHARHIGHPILGDATYASVVDEAPRMCLHAFSLRFHLAPFDGRGHAAAVGSASSQPSRDGERTSIGSAAEAEDRHGVEACGEQVVDAVAPDPFVFVDGELRL